MRARFAHWVAGVALAASAASAEDLSRFADPYIGCSYNGHCFAAAAYPLGMVQPGPDTGNTWWDYCSGYRYADTSILGFSQTHISGTGCGDLGDVLVMPFTGDVDLSRTNFASAYRKETQAARPGYYAVALDDNHAKVEIAAAKHAAIYRIDYLGDGAPRLFVDLQYGILNWGDRTGVNRVLACDVRREGESRIVGTVRTRMWVTRTYHFTLEFDRPIADWADYPRRDARERGRRFALGFARKDGTPLMMKFAISANSVEAARRNLAAEIPDWDLKRVREDARAAWNGVFAKMVAEGTEAQKRTFYTSLYHLFIQPNDIADVGEKPRYSTFSTWDTFRAAHPLYTIIAPERVDDFVGSMLRDWTKRGYLPIWTLWGEDNQCMIGTHSIPVIVDWFLKSRGGASSVDWQMAYAAVRDTLTRKHQGRGFEPWDLLREHGYIPFDKVGSESVSRTLEFAYDDWCAARFAEALGKREDMRFFDDRAHSWTNVYDRVLCLARGRDSCGNWREPFNPFKLNVGERGEGAKDFTEGNSWQYSWHVMQHPDELIAFHGGKEKFAEHLDRLFRLPERQEGMGFALDATGLIGQYAHGNEPSHHTIYFFQFAGRGDRTAELVREVCDRFYLPEPEGLCGNDDCGQMSAWYLFSAMGFYPFNPCGGEYVIGAPQVPKVTLNLAGGKTFTMTAKNLSKANKYVRAATLNGKPLAGHVIRHADVMAGGELVFEMADQRTRRN